MPPPAGLLLAPGAGAGASQPQLVAIDEALSALGWVVARMDFPYRLAGRRAPDRAPVLLAAVRDAAAELIERTGLPAERLVLGGRSMGGRICSMAVADGLPAAGLILISYPLRPPGRPDKLAERTAHFPHLSIPCLFVSGTKDAFGSPSELEAATKAIPGPVAHAWIEGASHALHGPDVRIGERVVEWAGSPPAAPPRRGIPPLVHRARSESGTITSVQPLPGQWPRVETMEREPVLMKKVLLAACGATLTVGALIPVGLSSAGADPASAATASAFGASIDLAGQDVLPPRGTATITLPPGGNDGPNALLLVPVEPVAVSGTASGQATATTASDIPTSLKQVTQAVPGPYNARAIGLIENLDVLTSVAGVGTSLVSASAVRGEAVGVCRGGAAQYSANSEIIDLNIGGTSIPLNAPLQSLIDAVEAVLDPLAMVVDIERNQVVVNADGASVVALRITVLGALNGVPIVDQEPLADIILGAAEVRGLRCGRVPQCSDTQDNDGDGKIDAQDPGCINDQGVFDPNDDDETDRLPRTAAVPNNSGGGELPRTGGTSTAPLAGGLAVLALGALTLRRRSQAAR